MARRVRLGMAGRVRDELSHLKSWWARRGRWAAAALLVAWALSAIWARITHRVTVVVALIAGAHLALDRALAWLACWAIARTPKRFVWTIDRLCVRPSWSRPCVQASR